MTTPKHYPLQWPSGVERHEQHHASQFKVALSAAMNNVHKSLGMFGRDTSKPVEEVVVSSNSTLGNEKPKDTGVAVWFLWEGEWRCIAADRYASVRDNVQAIHHLIEAERTKLRHGGLNIVRATFRAYLALPASGPTWWQILGVKQDASPDQIRQAWKYLIAMNHPDKGGSAEAASAINAARDEGLRERENA